MSLKWNKNSENKGENDGEEETVEFNNTNNEENSCSLPKREEKECEACT